MISYSSSLQSSVCQNHLYNVLCPNDPMIPNKNAVFLYNFAMSLGNFSPYYFPNVEAARDFLRCCTQENVNFIYAQFVQAQTALQNYLYFCNFYRYDRKHEVSSSVTTATATPVPPAAASPSAAEPKTPEKEVPVSETKKSSPAKTNTRNNTPAFDSFLNAVTGNDPQLKNLIWQMIGYMVSPKTTIGITFILQGTDDPGKTTLVNLVKNLMPLDITDGPEIDLFSENATRDMFSWKVFWYSNTIPEEPISQNTVNLWKQIMDYENSENHYTKCLLETDHTVTFAKLDPELSEHIVVIPFSSACNEKDHPLETLQNEIDAIIVKAIKAYNKMIRNGDHFDSKYKLNEVFEKN